MLSNALVAVTIVSVLPNLLLFLIPQSVLVPPSRGKDKPRGINWTRVMICFAVGGLLGDVFLHILPHITGSHSHAHGGHSHADHSHDHSHNPMVGSETMKKFNALHVPYKKIHDHQHDRENEHQMTRKGQHREHTDDHDHEQHGIHAKDHIHEHQHEHDEHEHDHDHEQHGIHAKDHKHEHDEHEHDHEHHEYDDDHDQHGLNSKDQSHEHEHEHYHDHDHDQELHGPNATDQSHEHEHEHHGHDHGHGQHRSLEEEADHSWLAILNLDRSTIVQLVVLLGFFIFFIAEKIANSFLHHSHDDHRPVAGPEKSSRGLFDRITASGYLNLLADSMHNFTDGIAIGASFASGHGVGLATFISVTLHEVPHEIGDLSLLVQNGLSKSEAIKAQFVTAVWAFVGTVVGYGVERNESMENLLLALTSGGFLYIATVSMLPPIVQDSDAPAKEIALQMIMFLLGVFLMILVLFFEEGH